MKNKSYFTKKPILSVAAILIVVCVFVGLLIYRGTLQADLSDVNCETLNIIMEQQRFTFTSKLKDQKSVIQTYAASLAYAEKLSESELLEKLRVITKNSTFDSVNYVMPDGETLKNTGVRLNVADRDYFKQALAGETVIANPVQSRVTGEDIVTFATPIVRDGKVTAVLAGIYDTHNFSKLLLPLFGGNGYTYITTGEGDIIVKTGTGSSLALYSNLFEEFKGLDAYEFDDGDTIVSNVAAGIAGHSRYYRDGEKRLMHYAPMGINDWYIFTIAPDSVIAPGVVDIMHNTSLFLFMITGLSILVGLYFFITQRQHLKELNKIAFIDSLTGAPNRKCFKMTAAEHLSATGGNYAFLILDIDKFKVFNDTFGYKNGDLFLVGIADILKKDMKEDEFFGRCDSDEYYILLRYRDDDTIRIRAQSMIDQIETLFKAKLSDSYRLVICIGVYVIFNPLESISSICDRARHAHRLIKGGEESGICFYDDEIRHKIIEEKEIENKMHAALEKSEFLLYLQPKYYLKDESIYGAEALVRWRTGSGELIYPDHFIPVFEKNGFITKLDLYMLDKTCQTIRRWIDSGITPIPVSINFSRLHLKNLDFVDNIAEIVEHYHIPPELIEVELTESTMLNNEAVLMEMLTHLHGHGITLSMDDFGSGYSSLGLLKNLPVDVIKLDRSFFVDYCELKRAVTVISAIISMAKNLGIKTVAEGVETKEQIDFLKELGCDIVQGYYYAKPMEEAELTELLEEAAKPEQEDG